MRFFRENGLSIALFSLFFISVIGQYFTGLAEYNEDLKTHRQAEVSAIEYLGEGHFIEAIFENWESEFLQMGMYVVLTVFLYQKGSSESKTPGTLDRVDIILDKEFLNKDAPAPVKRGGFSLKIYQNSLSIAFFLLFFISFYLHAYGGAKDYNKEQTTHGQTTVTVTEYMTTSRFWFESFQNWQSEFLSMGLMVVLSIFLRQKGSPESKPVDAPHSETGTG
ncbi:MAG: hypothetical protein JWN60_1119 [Acidobacteria bacterium]|jgi:hypothetical protein|nr:hypothetical protein [Acidobacteriota bacterium]